MADILIVSIASFIDSTGEIPFIFKKANCNVDVFCGSSSWLISNHFYDNWIDSGENNEQEFWDRLLKLIKKNPDKYDKVVTTDDATNKLLNEYVADDVNLFSKLLPITKIENRQILSSKCGLSIILNKYGINTPAYLIYSEKEDLGKVIGSMIFPILLKVDYSFSGIGLKLVEKSSDLEGAINEIYKSKNLVIQEFIEGVDLGVEALFDKGRLVMYNLATIQNYMYHKFSFTTSRTYIRDIEIEKLLIELGEKVGINGFASIQYIYHPKRKIYYLIEADLRTNSWMSYSRFTRQDFSDGIQSIYNNTNESKIDTKSESINEKTEIIIFDRDIRRCIKNKDFKGLMKWVINWNGCWKFIPTYDSKYFGRIRKKMWFDFSKKII